MKKTAMQDLINDLDKIKKNLTQKTEIQTIQLIIDTAKNKYLQTEKEQIEKAVVFGNRQDFYDGTEEIGSNYYNSTYTQSSE